MDLIEQSEKDYYKPVRIGIFYYNNYIDSESNGDRTKILLIREYLQTML